MMRTNLNLGVVVLVGIALALAGCGGSSSSSGVAHIGTASAANASSGSAGGTPESGETPPAVQQQMVKFAQCMRTHGEPEFPEPNEGKLLIRKQNGHGPNPESAKFQAAEKACAKYSPAKVAPSPAQRAKMEEAALKFSACMRTHGVPNFPDPEFRHGGGTVRLRIGGAGKGAGIDPNSPQFQAAQKACQSTLPKGAKGGPIAAGPPPGGGGGGQGSGAVAVP
jgi:hypothetical protein